MIGGAMPTTGARRRRAVQAASAAVLVLTVATVPAATRLTAESMSEKDPARSHPRARDRRGRRREVPQATVPAAPMDAGTRPLRAAQAEAATVGPLFYAGGGHHCTASVVSSPGGNLLVTAAHCIFSGGGYRGGVEFAPGYSGGSAPYGRWRVAAMFVDSQWADTEAEDDDVGFIVVSPEQGRTLEQVTGANRLGVGYNPASRVRVTGYPSAADSPVSCTRTSTPWSSGQMRFDCDGFTSGTSGGPWVTDDGSVIGVIGGHQRGGDTAAISYSPRFGTRIKALYDSAIGPSHPWP